MSETRLRSGMLVFPNLTQLDLTGPYKVLAPLPGAETLLLWKTLDPVRSEHGLTILPMATLAACPPLDLILVPGGAPAYGATFAHATSGFVGALLDAARVAAGMQILDLACGPGLVAGAARGRGAVPIGLDFSAVMIALARAAHPGIRFEEGDAEAVPFPDGSFDAVVANFGIHHVPDPVRALTEARRVLRPGGRMAFTTWAAPAENIAWRLLFDAISAHGDPQAAKTPPSGGGLRDPEDLLRILIAAGFGDTEARRVTGEWRFAAAGDLVEGFRRGTVRTAALIGAQPAAALPAIEAAIAQSAAAYRRPDGFAVPVVAILGSAVRPRELNPK
jgi:SAM-dependent methyltransferase